MDDMFLYAEYDDYDKLSNNCIEYLMNNNEDVWKLLKYTDNMPLEHDNLTKNDKRMLVYSGMQQDTTDYRVFLDRGQDDAMTENQCVLKISPYTLHPSNSTNGKISMLFEVYCGYKINHIIANQRLDNGEISEYYTTRVDCVIKNLLKTFNGADIGGLGRLSLNKKQSYDNGVKQYGSIPWKGSWIIMSNNIA